MKESYFQKMEKKHVTTKGKKKKKKKFADNIQIIFNYPYFDAFWINDTLGLLSPSAYNDVTRVVNVPKLLFTNDNNLANDNAIQPS